MKGKKVVIRLERLTGHNCYHVKSVTNSLKPRAGELLNSEEVADLIGNPNVDDVVISRERS